jgi:hypothetical protein
MLGIGAIENAIAIRKALAVAVRNCDLLRRRKAGVGVMSTRPSSTSPTSRRRMGGFCATCERYAPAVASEHAAISARAPLVSALTLPQLVSDGAHEIHCISQGASQLRVKVERAHCYKRNSGLLSRRIGAARGLIEEPDLSFRLVDMDFEQARGGDVVMLLAEVMRLSHSGDEALIVLAQLRQHVLRIDIVPIIVGGARGRQSPHRLRFAMRVVWRWSRSRQCHRDAQRSSSTCSRIAWCSRA